MEARDFIVLHTLGAQWVKARSAADAVRLSCVPGGYRHVRGVVEAALARGENLVRPLPPEAPFIAFIGQPV